MKRKRSVYVKAGRSADFMLRIMGRAGKDWQGKVEHVQSGQVQQFRSCIELFRLMQEKLERTGCPQSAMERRLWPDRPGKYLVKGDRS